MIENWHFSASTLFYLYIFRMRCYQEDKDVYNKLNSFQYICGTVRGSIKNHTIKERRDKFYKILAVPICGSVVLGLLPYYKNWAQTREMRFRYAREDPLDKHKKYEHRWGSSPSTKKMVENRNKWKSQLDRKSDTKPPKSGNEKGRSIRRWADLRG